VPLGELDEAWLHTTRNHYDPRDGHFVYGLLPGPIPAEWFMRVAEYPAPAWRFCLPVDIDTGVFSALLRNAGPFRSVRLLNTPIAARSSSACQGDMCEFRHKDMFMAGNRRKSHGDDRNRDRVEPFSEAAKKNWHIRRWPAVATAGYALIDTSRRIRPWKAGAGPCESTSGNRH